MKQRQRPFATLMTTLERTDQRQPKTRHTWRTRVIAMLALMIPATLFLGIRPAAAGRACDWFGICGNVVNHSSNWASIAQLDVAGGSRCERDTGQVHDCEVKSLPPGESGSTYFKDVDAVAFPRTGMYIGSYSYYVPPGKYYKIGDGTTLECRDTNPTGLAEPLCK